MKKIIYILILVSLSRQLIGQTSNKDNDLANTRWDSNWSKSDFGDGFKMAFSSSTVTITNGPNTYVQYKYYKLKNDTLIIGGTSPLDAKKISKPLKNYPTFKVNKIDKDSLLITALNWRALYITGTLTTPYIDVDYKKFIELDKKLDSKTDLSQGGAVNDHIDLFRLK